MKKVLYFAAAALALAACSKNEVLDVNKGEAISFRTVMNGSTKATNPHDVTTENLSEFIVTAQTATPTNYFQNVEFTKSGTTFVSTNKYYWPGDNSELTFYAYAPKNATGVAYNATTPANVNVWTVTQQTTPANQPDLVVAKNTGKKSTNATGVALNFRHTMAKLSVKVKNSNTGMKMEVKNWKVAYIYDKGIFTLGETDTNDNNTGSGTTLEAGDWTYTDAAQAVGNEVNNGDDLATAKGIAAEAPAASVDGFGDFIVIPQAMKSGVPAYATAAASAAWTTPYIAVLMTIKNNTTAGEVIAEEQWCCWPISTTWVPGKHYTYTIDLADGGYKEKNVVNADPETTDLDPVLDNAEIKFVSVTVDDWTPHSDTGTGDDDPAINL